MAKKRKSKASSKKSSAKKTNNSSKSKKEEKSKKKQGTPEGFWLQVGAIAMLLMAVLMLFGSFNSGGTLSIRLFEWGQWLLGGVAYILPVLLVVAAVIKLRSEDHKIPRSIFWGFIILFFAAAGFAHLFVEDGMSLEAVDTGDGGGFIGHISNSIIVGPLTRVTGGIVLFVISVVALHFVFRLPLNYLLRFLRLSKREAKGSEAVAAETPAVDKKAEKAPKFKLNEGVPLQRTKTPLKPGAVKVEVQEALTATTDTDWNFPPLDLLDKKIDKVDAGDIEERAEIIKATLSEFGIDTKVDGANVGPRITQYTMIPASGVKLNKIYSYDRNLAFNLAAESIRIEAPIPGKRAVGIEVPNKSPAIVRMHSILTSKNWKKGRSPLNFVLGKDISGEPVIEDLDKMPHLLVAGATNTGKSVMIHSLLVSLLYKNSPSDLKLILVDPKGGVELDAYKELPHLITPIISEAEKCVSALKWSVNEMERRYQALREYESRNIQEYNARRKEEGMPFIVIVIDELADFMQIQNVKREMENLVSRLAAKARAVGIHLVLATQSPRKDVITGLIKANINARIALRANTQIDSRVILDRGGAEKLLGNGDMLFMSPVSQSLKRIQGAFLSNEEVRAVADFIRMERAPEYDDNVISQPVNLGGSVGSVGGESEEIDDNLYEAAIETFISNGKGSTALLQRKLRIGYSRAARLVDAMEDHGIVSPSDGARPREVLVSSVEEALNRGAPQDDTYEPEPYEENF